MNQLDCDIVRDLMPSYLDHLCSESSRKAVECHVETCALCRENLETLRSTSLVSQEAEKAQIDFMKKVRQHYVRNHYGKVLLLFVLSLLILVLSTCFFLKSTIDITLYYYILFPVLSLGTWFLLSDCREKPKQGPIRTICGLISILGILAGLSAEYFLCRAVGSPSINTLFGHPLHQTGPWITACLIGMAAVELLLYAFLTVDALRQGYSLGILPVLSLAGCILCLAFRLLLYGMSDYDALLTSVWQINGIILLEAGGVSLIEFLVKKIQERHLQAGIPGSL